MKNASSLIKSQILCLMFVLAAAMVASAQENRYVSKYNIAFQTPKTMVKSADSTDDEVTFERSDDGGFVGLFQLVVSDDTPKDALDAMLSPSPGLEKALLDGYIEGIKEGITDAKVTILGKSRVQIAGFNSFKALVLIETPDIKFRAATYMIPVPAHRRMYSFNVMALDSRFDEWLAEAEPSVKSFELISKAHK